MSFGNYKRKHYIALVKNEDIPYLSDLKRLANKITTITDDSDEQTESSVFYDSLNGAGDEILLGRTESWSVAGQYDPTDPAHMIIANMRRKDDEERLVWHFIEETNGTFVLGIAKILNPVAGGGEAGEKEELSFRITFIKKPNVYDKMPDFPEKEAAKAPTDFEVVTGKKPYSKTQKLSWKHKENILFTIYKNKERFFETTDKTYVDVLKNGEKSTYYITATNELGESNPTEEITAERIEPPKPVLEVAYEHGEVVILIDSVYKEHEIYKNDVKIEVIDQEIFHDVDVKEGETYSYFAKGINEDFDDLTSDPIEIKVPVTPPQKPQIELVKKTDTTIEIKIANEEKNVVYTYHMNDQEVDSLTQTNLKSETTYIFKVCATKLTETVCSDELSVTTEKEMPKVSNLTYSITEQPYEINLKWDTTDDRASYIVKSDSFEKEATQTELTQIAVKNIKNTFSVTPKLDNMIGDTISIVTYARPNQPKAEIKVDDKTATITITDIQDNVSYIYKHDEQETEIKNKKAILTLNPGTHNIEVFAVVEKGRSNPTVLTVEVLENPIAVTEAGVVAKTKNSFTIQFVKTNAEKYKVGIKETGFSDTTTDDTYAFVDLKPDTTYTFFIVSVIGDKESETFTSMTSTGSALGEIIGQGKWGTMDYVTYKNSEGYTTCVLGSGETGKDGTPKANHLIFDGDVEKFNTKYIGNDYIYEKITINKILDEDCTNLFRDSKNEEFDLSNFDTSSVTSMSSMFQSSRATTLDLSNFDTSSVTNMSYMFQSSRATTLDLSNFDTSSVTSMSYMFESSQSTALDLSNFDTSSVTSMSSMFQNSQATTLDLSNFDTSSVTSMSSMFESSRATTLDLSNFDTSSVTNMSYMFQSSRATTLDLSNFDTSSVTSMSYMFESSQSTALDLSNFDTSSVTSMSSMFQNSQATTLDLSNFNTSNVTTMSSMFSNSQATKIKLGEKFKFKVDHKLYGRWIKEDDPDVVFVSENDWRNNYDGTKHAGWYVKDTAQTLEWYEDDLDVEEQNDDTDE